MNSCTVLIARPVPPRAWAELIFAMVPPVPFGPAWWAFTFPLDAYAYAAARYAQAHPAPLWKGVAAAALTAATLVVVLVLAKTLVALARGELLAPAATPRSDASRAA